MKFFLSKTTKFAKTNLGILVFFFISLIKRRIVYNIGKELITRKLFYELNSQQSQRGFYFDLTLF